MYLLESLPAINAFTEIYRKLCKLCNNRQLYHESSLPVKSFASVIAYSLGLVHPNSG